MAESTCTAVIRTKSTELFSLLMDKVFCDDWSFGNSLSIKDDILQMRKQWPIDDHDDVQKFLQKVIDLAEKREFVAYGTVRNTSTDMAEYFRYYGNQIVYWDDLMLGCSDYADIDAAENDEDEELWLNIRRQKQFKGEKKAAYVDELMCSSNGFPRLSKWEFGRALSEAQARNEWLQDEDGNTKAWKKKMIEAIGEAQKVAVPAKEAVIQCAARYKLEHPIHGHAAYCSFTEKKQQAYVWTQPPRKLTGKDTFENVKLALKDFCISVYENDINARIVVLSKNSLDIEKISEFTSEKAFLFRDRPDFLLSQVNMAKNGDSWIVLASDVINMARSSEAKEIFTQCMHAGIYDKLGKVFRFERIPDDETFEGKVIAYNGSYTCHSIYEQLPGTFTDYTQDLESLIKCVRAERKELTRKTDYYIVGPGTDLNVKKVVKALEMMDDPRYHFKVIRCHDFIFHILEHELYKSDTNKETVTDQ